MSWRISFSVIILAALLGIATAQEDAKDISIKPIEEIQSFLHAFSSKDLKERQKLFSTGTEEEVKQKLTELQGKAGGPQELVAQLLYFRVHAKGVREAMMPLFVMEQLNISAGDRVAAILPSLETDDKSVLKVSHEWLEGIDYDRKTREYKFGRYEDIIRKKDSDVPKGLIKYMYTKSSNSALLTMANVYLKKNEAKALIGKAKDKDEPKTLAQLSERSEWWIHLYIAEKIRKNSKLRSSAIVEQLKKSEHPLVLEVIKDVEKK